MGGARIGIWSSEWVGLGLVSGLMNCMKQSIKHIGSIFEINTITTNISFLTEECLNA